MALVLGHWQLRGFGLWAVEERATGLLAGRVGCWQPEGWPGLEIGWAFRREFWGRGYATEAAQMVLVDTLFPSAASTRLISLIHPQNERSIAVALRLGMRREQDTEIMGHPACRLRHRPLDATVTAVEPRPAPCLRSEIYSARYNVCEKYNDFTEFGLPVQMRMFIILMSGWKPHECVSSIRSESDLPLSPFHPLGRPVGPFGTTRKVIKWVVTPWSQEIDGG